MLTSLHADNFKCLSNFDLQIGDLSLWLGRNGSGKSTAFDALARIRDFVLGRRDCVGAFPSDTLTRWDTRSNQHFRLCVRTAEDALEYRLEIEHDRSRRRNRVLREELVTSDGQPLFEFLRGDVHLYRDDHSIGPVFPSDWQRSALATVPERDDNRKLSSFKRWLDRLWVLSLDPRRMAGDSFDETTSPAPDMVDFASWYRHVLQEAPRSVSTLFDVLRRVFSDFAELRLSQAGEARRLRVHLLTRRNDGAGGGARTSGFDYDFAELSDGQRALITLYALIELGVRRGATVAIDEPDNFVALVELQPWLAALREAIEDGGGQALLISHHPEVINYLAADSGMLFERQDGGPVQVRRWPDRADSGLTAAETLARGWE